MGRKNKNKNQEESCQYEDFIPYAKSSKREKRRRDREKRNTWNISPATKVMPNKKKRENSKKKKDDYYYDEDWDY